MKSIDTVLLKIFSTVSLSPCTSDLLSKFVVHPVLNIEGGVHKVFIFGGELKCLNDVSIYTAALNRTLQPHFQMYTYHSLNVDNVR